MKKQRIWLLAIIFTLTIVGLSVSGVFQKFFVLENKTIKSPDQVPKIEEKQWIRSVDTSVQSGTILELPALANLSWGFGGQEKVPPLQHGPIVLSDSFNEARFFNVKDGEVNIYKGQGEIIYQRNWGDTYTIPVFVFAPDLNEFAYVAQRWNEPGVSVKSTVATSDWTSNEYDSVSQPVFSRDGKHFAFTGARSESSIAVGIPSTRFIDVILDGKIIATHDVGSPEVYNELNWNNPMVSFNPITNEISYTIEDRGNSFIVYEGNKQKSYMTIEDAPKYSAEGNKISYKAYIVGLNFAVGMPDNESVAICGGTENSVEKIQNVGDVILSNDGTICVYIGSNGRTDEFIVRNGEVVDESVTGERDFRDFYHLTLTSAGEVAYIASNYYDNEDTYVYVGEKVFGPFTSTWQNFLKLSPVTDTPAFQIAVQIGEVEEYGNVVVPVYGHAIQIRTETGAVFSEVEPPIIDESRKLIAYAAKRDYYFSEEEKGEYIVIGSSEFGPYDDVWSPIFSGNQLIFGARDKNEVMRVVVDNIE